MTTSEHPDALPQGYRLHWYVLDRVLGEGGFGITYLARDTNLDQPVAIKEYLPVEIAARRSDASVRARTEEQQERYRWGLDRFLKEARTLARFDHPNIVRVHSVFEFNGTAYMVMRLEEGETLESMLERRRTLPEEEIVRVILPVLDGLEMVHGAGFIHRDIKPDNILIRADGTPVLLDFGSARHALGRVRTVTILVAPGYAPFEQYYSTGENQGPWTDIYGLGATCYRAIAGAPPMDAIARSKGILGSTRELLVPARNVGQGRYGEAFLRAVDRALEFAERDRPQTIAEWRSELAGGAPAAAAAPARAAPAGQAAPAAPARQLSTTALVTVVAAVAVTGGGVGAYLMRGPAQEKKAESADARPAPAQQAATEDAAARAKQEEEQRARHKAEQDRIAREKAEQELAAKKRAEEERIAREKAERDRLAREKAAKEAERQARLVMQREKERLARLKAEADKPGEAKPAPPPGPVKDSRPPPPGTVFAQTRALAIRGDADAALRLGELYEKGQGTLPNANWAHLWYAIAELRGAQGAKARKEAAATRLQPKEIEQNERHAPGLARPGE
jgi:hypothetical protein